MTNAIADESTAAAAAVPPPHRRPRVREVSSRFMSPLLTSSNTNATPTPTPTPSETHHRNRSKSAQRHHQEAENIPDTIRNGLDTPLLKSFINQKHHYRQHQQQQKVFDILQKKSSSVSIGVGKTCPPPSSSRRPDTPNVIATTDRIVPSRYKQSFNHHQTISAAGTLLQQANCGYNNDTALVLQRKQQLSRISTSAAAELSDSSTSTNQPLSQPRSCPNSPVFLCTKNNNSNNSGRTSENSKFAASPCSRSLDLQPSNGDQSSCWLPFKPAVTASTKSYSKIGGTGTLALPPHPIMSSKPEGKRVPNHQEDMQSLKMLRSHYLQWRFANAKAEASMLAQKMEAERNLYALGSNIADLLDVVKRKRIELTTLQRLKTLSTIFEGHMPYLDEWSGVEEDYSTSLSGIISALLNTSLRLPVSGEVRADVRELGEALNSSMKVMEMIGLHIQSFMPKAEELDALSSELARVIGGERALIEEYGHLMFRTHTSQVNEWSLRGHLIQLDRGKYCLSQQE